LFRNCIILSLLTEWLRGPHLARGP